MKKLLFTVLAIVFSSLIALSQRGFDEDYDEDHEKSMERLSNLGLTTGEIISIAVGIILLLIAKSIDKKPNLKNGIGCIGILFALPLIMTVFAVAQKILVYGIMLAMILGVVYMIFGEEVKKLLK